MKIIYSSVKSFYFAFSGWIYVIRTQNNFRVHIIATVVVILISALLHIEKLEWIAIILIIGMVWITEFFNTSIEVLVDLVSPDYHPLAKVCKDVAAGSVLVTALVAVLVGAIIFLPRLFVFVKN
jgi:diacylglycerol kinase